jgi:hypothetical protein
VECCGPKVSTSCSKEKSAYLPPGVYLTIAGSIGPLRTPVIMDLSKRVYDLCNSTQGDKAEELTAFLQEHPEVDVNLYRNANGFDALLIASKRGKLRCIQVLIGHGADLEARIGTNGKTPLILASHYGQLDCLKVLIEAKADVNARNKNEFQALHFASLAGKTGCVKLLINEGADVNAQTNSGSTPLMHACQEERLTCLQLLLDAKADINMRANVRADALYLAIRMLQNATAHRVPGMPFSVLSCNTNATDIRIDRSVTRATVDGHIAEYKAVHAFIDEHHSILKHALSRDVQVDRRVGLGANGIYQEPLERVLEYMGLSMNVDQVVNERIDVDGKRRALRPGNVLEANHWHEQFTIAQNRAAVAKVARQMEENKLAIEATRQARRAHGGY